MTRSRTTGRAPIELEEHSHAGMANRYAAGAARLPFAVHARLRRAPICVTQTGCAPITCPFTGEELTAVPALRPDVAIVHAQEADRDGNVQLWGIPGVQKEAVLARDALAGDRGADRRHARAAPRRGGHPRLGDRCRRARRPVARGRPTASGITDRDNDFYRLWDKISRDRDAIPRWMNEHVLASGRRRRETAAGEAPSELQTVVAARRLRHPGRCSSASAGRARPRSWRGWSTTRSSSSSTSRGRSAPSRPRPALDRRRRARPDR